jgi:hypothetical protein
MCELSSLSSENCLSVDGLLEFAETLGTILTPRNQSILRKLTIDGNLHSLEQRELILPIFSYTVRELSAIVISNYSRFAEFEAQM